MIEVDEGAHIGVVQMLFSLRDHGAARNRPCAMLKSTTQVICYIGAVSLKRAPFH